jgi:hypothetical protein
MKKERNQSDNDGDEEEEEEDDEQEEQAPEPVVRIANVHEDRPRPKYVMMDYDKRMGDGVIPNNKVIRPINHWCYTTLDPAFWGENSIDRCPTYRTCRICCSSGPMGKHEKLLYFCMQIKLKNNKGEEITRMLDAQWILRVMEATHLDALVNRVQE